MRTDSGYSLADAQVQWLIEQFLPFAFAWYMAVSANLQAACTDAIYLDLELPSAQRQLDDPEAYFLAHQNQLVILDEVQRFPDLFAVLRGVIDLRRRNGEATGQFLLLGSASGALLQQTSESLAGRVAQLELTPFQARELLPSQSFPMKGGIEVMNPLMAANLIAMHS